MLDTTTPAGDLVLNTELYIDGQYVLNPTLDERP